MTMEVHPWREHHLVPEPFRFIPQHFTHLTVQLGIERGRARRCRWKGSRSRLRITVATPDSGSAIDHADGRNAKLGNALNVTSYRLEVTTRRTIRIDLGR